MAAKMRKSFADITRNAPIVELDKIMNLVIIILSQQMQHNLRSTLFQQFTDKYTMARFTAIISNSKAWPQW